MLLVDSADIDELTATLRYPGIQGVTTNPNLVARSADVEFLSAQGYAERLLALTDAVQALTPLDDQVRQLMVQPSGSNHDILEVAARLRSRIQSHVGGYGSSCCQNGRTCS
jgi:transaldolase